MAESDSVLLSSLACPRPRHRRALVLPIEEVAELGGECLQLGPVAYRAHVTVGFSPDGPRSREPTTPTTRCSSGVECCALT